MIQVTFPFAQFTDKAGQPLDAGFIYIGTENLNPETNPIALFWDDALTIPAAQPLRTINGYISRNGSPGRVYANTSAYSITVRDKSRNIIATALDASALDNLRADLAAPAGSSLIGHLPISLIATTVQAALRQLEKKTINVQDYVTGGLGTSESPWTGWDTGISWAAFRQYNFIDGYYSYATSPNFGLTGLRLQGQAGTVVRHTGTGYAMVFDAGPLSTDIVINTSANLRLESNAGAAGGVYSRGIVHSEFEFDFHNVPGVCFTDIFSVLNKTRLKHTGLVVGGAVFPTTLLNVEKRNAGELSSANKYWLLAENCSSVGVALNNCSNSIFHSGASENNFAGMYISPTSQYNTFINADYESNTSYDINCEGAFNEFIGGVSSGVSTFGGLRNNINGGIYNTVNSSGIKNTFKAVNYGSAAGAFTDTGAGTIKQNVYGVTSGAYDIDVINKVTSIKTNDGSVSALNSTPTTLISAAQPGRYEVMVYLAAGAAALYTASATVLSDSAGSSRIIANNGSNLMLTLSGQTVQTTQTSGATQTVFYSYLKIG